MNTSRTEPAAQTVVNVSAFCLMALGLVAAAVVVLATQVLGAGDVYDAIGSHTTAWFLGSFASFLLGGLVYGATRS